MVGEIESKKAKLSSELKLSKEELEYWNHFQKTVKNLWIQYIRAVFAHRRLNRKDYITDLISYP